MSSGGQPRHRVLQAGSLGAKFERLAAPDKRNGVSRLVMISEMPDELAAGFGNGASWARSDGPLGQKYHIERPKESGKIIGVQLLGYRRQDAGSAAIPTSVYDALVGQPCVVTGSTTDVEIDHKFGRKDGPASDDVEDYQPLHATINKIKREHCKSCKETNRRFDAKKLGYSSGWFAGGQNFVNCIGCYWHDPKEFNAIASRKGFAHMELQYPTSS